MTEDDAKAWFANSFNVSRETTEKIEAFIALLSGEMHRQNLISASSANHIWARHVVDSAQILKFVSSDKIQDRQLKWLDLGTGAGFPGIITAIITDMQVICVESRARRVEFLNTVISDLGLNNCEIKGQRLETIKAFEADIISARAFAPLPKLIATSHRFSTENTIWLLPKGKNAVREWEELPTKQRKMFHVEQSITDADAKILIGKGCMRP